LMFFNVSYESSAIEEFSLNSAKNQDLNDESPDVYSEDDNFSKSSTESESVITGSEQFPGKLLLPQNKKIIIHSELLDLLVEYYTAAYEMLSFRKPFANVLDNSIIVCNLVDQFGRYQIGSEIYGSDISSHYIKSLFILAWFVNQDRSIDLYPGQV
ncbi:22092_t:CDS:2, partial [Racocetra persica]